MNKFKHKKQTPMEWMLIFHQLVLEKYMDPNLKIKDLAQVMNISERTLRSRVVKEGQISPSRYIMKIRLQKSYEYIMQQKFATLSEVCYAVGFKDLAHFSKAFKRQYGVSPSAIHTIEP